MPADALRIRGRHNAANALAALALATAIGCALAPMLHGLREYGGEPHRVEPVGRRRRRRGLRRQQGHQCRRHRGRARRPGCRALAGQAGGDPGRRRQGAGFRAAGGAGGTLCARRGADRPRCGGHRSGPGLERRAAARATPACPKPRHGASSRRAAATPCCCRPACASLDMFRNYGHRADVFVEAVRQRGGRARGGHRMTRRRLAVAALAAGRAARRSSRCRCATSIDVTPQRSASLASFDQPLVLGERGLAGPGPGDGLFGLDRAARQPALRTLRAHLFPGATSCRWPSASSPRCWRCRCPIAVWEKYAPWCFVVSLVLLVAVLIPQRRQGGQRRAPLAAAGAR